jgi:hypothetical protein
MKTTGVKEISFYNHGEQENKKLLSHKSALLSATAVPKPLRRFITPIMSF